MLSITTIGDFYNPYILGTVAGMNWRNRMENRRKELKLTQKALADRLGVELATYGHWAHARREPNLETFEAIAAELRVSPSWLLYGIDSPGDAATAHVLDVMQHLPEYKREILVKVADGLTEREEAAPEEAPRAKRSAAN